MAFLNSTGEATYTSKKIPLGSISNYSVKFISRERIDETNTKQFVYMQLPLTLTEL